MSILRRMFGGRWRKKARPGGMAGAVFAQQAPVGLRKENGIFLAVRRGIRKTEAEKGRKKSKKQLRRERDARYFARVQQKQFEGAG